MTTIPRPRRREAVASAAGRLRGTRRWAHGRRRRRGRCGCGRRRRRRRVRRRRHGLEGGAAAATECERPRRARPVAVCLASTRASSDARGAVAAPTLTPSALAAGFSHSRRGRRVVWPPYGTKT